MIFGKDFSHWFISCTNGNLQDPGSHSDDMDSKHFDHYKTMIFFLKKLGYGKFLGPTLSLFLIINKNLKKFKVILRFEFEHQLERIDNPA